MNALTGADTGIKRVLDSELCLSATGKVELFDLDGPPRLRSSDLEEPERFHHRLVEWLMMQR